jgi:stage II sporulation protein D
MKFSRLSRRSSRIVLSIVVAAGLTSWPPVAHADVPATFSFSGAGFGHGVGMSQIGAKVRALSGESATAILNYYYKDVVVAPVIDTATIRVNIAHDVRTVAFMTPAADSSFEIYAGEIPSGSSASPILTFRARQKASVNFDGKNLSINGALVSGKIFTVRWFGALPVMSFSLAGTSTLYRYGQMQIRVGKSSMMVTNSLSVHDEYLLGLSEMPSSWPAAALEAQVIAARSYALAKLGPIRPACDCHVYDHISDQNFVGYIKETEKRVGVNWRNAVLRTNIDSSTSLALLARGKPIQAHYFSSSGGATQTTQDAWGQPTSYTQSVADPASLDVTHNPRFAQWKATSTQALVSAAFLLPNITSLEIMSRNSAGAVTWIKGIATDGSFKILRGDTFRSRAKIPSPYFSIN